MYAYYNCSSLHNSINRILGFSFSSCVFHYYTCGNYAPDMHIDSITSRPFNTIYTIGKIGSILIKLKKTTSRDGGLFKIDSNYKLD